MAVRTLIFGAGWLGQEFARRLPRAQLTKTDITNQEAVEDELDSVRPAFVVNCAGRTGRPNVDSLEDQPARTYRDNVAGPILLAGICRERGLHFTHLGSGCIYEGDAGGEGYGEEDPPNFHGSLYARSKIVAEQALRDLDALQLRIRLPLASVPAPRNLLTKLLGFDEVVSVPNSITVLDDFWVPAFELIQHRATGVYNMVNPGVERHDELLALWRERVDAEHAFRVVPQEDLAGRLTAARSNCILSTAKLEAEGLGLPPLEQSLPRVIDAYAAHLRM